MDDSTDDLHRRGRDGRLNMQEADNIAKSLQANAATRGEVAVAAERAAEGDTFGWAMTVDGEEMDLESETRAWVAHELFQSRATRVEGVFECKVLDQIIEAINLELQAEEDLSGLIPEIYELREARDWAKTLYEKRIAFPAISRFHDHVNALESADTDEGAFRTALARLRDDAGADAKLIWKIADGYFPALDGPQVGDRQSALGAVERAFNDRRSQLTRDSHVTALRQAGTDEDAFHLAFTRLSGDAAAGAEVVSKIAAAYIGEVPEAGDREGVLGAIETEFYARRQAQTHANGQRNGVRSGPR